MHYWHAPFMKFVVCVVLVLSSFKTFAGNEPDYDEVSLMLSVQGVGNTEVSGIVRNDVAYLSVTDVFDFLKIRNIPSAGLDSVSGYLISPQYQYIIDKINNRIEYKGTTFSVRADELIKTETGLYLRTDFFGKIFELECVFYFRSLSVLLRTNLELPVIHDMKQEVMRNNILRLKGQSKADTVVARKYPMFRFGTADWSVVSSQFAIGYNDTRLYLGLGSVVAGGEMNVALNYSSNLPFREKEQFYQWRYVDNNNNALRQSVAGKIYAQSTSSIFSPVVGVQFTNTPTTYRRSFGTYTISDYTEPHWTVELYVNNVLVNYVEADGAGFFSFQVPLVYGNSAVKLRFYGPYGEQRFREQNINIPFNFIPLHQLEYTASAGVVEDSLHSRYSRGNLNYGLSKRITIGGGVEYLSSVLSGKFMPFANASVRLSSNLLFATEYTYGVRSKTVLNYRLPSDLQFELDFTRYAKNQKAINTTFREERKAVISYPFRSNKFTAYTRLTFYNIILPTSKYSNAEALLSGSLFGINTNFTTYSLFTKSAKPYVYSNLSLVFRMKAKITFTPQVQYEYNQHKLIALKGELGKYLKNNGYCNLYYEKNYKSQFQSVGIGFRYNFSFAQVGFTARQSNFTSSLVETASGSFMYDDKSGYLAADNRYMLGKSGIMILPYLDLNANGKRDKGEPRVQNLKVQTSYGRVKYNQVDTAIYILGLEAYNECIVRLIPAFENVSWQIQKHTLSVITDPNQFKLIEVPVLVMHEVSGTVYLNENGSKNGLGRITVLFYKNGSTLVGKTQTEADGYFNLSGLTPGEYSAAIDPEQLQKLSLSATPKSKNFTITYNPDGDMVDGLDFELEHYRSMKETAENAK